ncbi:CHAT domain-containing protein [Microbacterium sp. CFBP9034]|uniref:CHAT domain-containing protein n=1 Tax=Microbacterium sp. CFBP9034 TaxID=3096540 RepID=UPI002A6B0E09|nr:CHAT domain-containing protein [Microbacterium sp. CFBP9034]MDY0910254.1 CHAT domain-containing protein [Microbacterium sp. CFBP9034]
MTRSATELHQRAVELCINGKYALAQRVLSRAEERTDDPDLRARIAGTRALALQRTGFPREAEELLTAVVGGRGLAPHTKAILLGQLGAIANYGGRLDEAERWLTRAIQSLDDDPVSAARVRVNRSLVRMQRRSLPDAADDLERAADTFARHQLVTDEAQARHNLGYASLLAGDLVAALQEMLAARPSAASTPVAEAIGDVDRAEVLRDAGLTTEAEQILARAAVIFGSHRMPQSRAEAEFHLARSLLSHDSARARKVAASAARRFRALGNTAWAARSDAVRLRAALGGLRVESTQDDHSRRLPASAEIDEVADQLIRSGFRGEAAALRIAAALARARRGEAVGHAIRVPVSSPMEVQLMAAELRSARAEAAGRAAEARRRAAGGLDVLGAWQRSFGSLDLQTSVAMHGANLIFAGLESAVRSGRPDVLFEWSERARHLSQQVLPLRPPPDPALASELAELRMLRAENPGGDWLSVPRAAALRERARQRQWASTGAVDGEERLDLERLRAELADDTALIAYVYSGTALVALVCTADRTTVVPVASGATVRRLQAGLRADLDMSASIRTPPMVGVVRRALDDRLRALSAVLLDDLAAIAGTSRLVITAPGLLNAIPWAMLPAMRGKVFTLAMSATRWARMRAPGSFPHASAGFAVGPRVARGEEEVDAAAAAWHGATVLRGTEASVAGVTSLGPAVDVLHIAAHGRHAVDNPLFSGLELADGTLFGYDIDLMPDVPDTVVLSACEVGRSSVRWGEEAIGMTRIWLHAGTRCVIAAPVIVADDVACELLGAMHAGLASGVAPAVALAQAAESTGITAPFQVHGAGF